MTLEKPLEIGPPFTLENYEEVMASTGIEQRMEKGEVGLSIYYGIRVAADGRGIFEHQAQPFDLSEIEDVPGYFAQKMQWLQEEEANGCIPAEEYGHKKRVVGHDAIACLDDVTLFDDAFLRLRGWGFCLDGVFWEKYILLGKNQGLVYKVIANQRTNVGATFGDERYGREAGFECLIDIRPIRDTLKGELSVSLGFEDGTMMRTCPMKIKGSI